MFAVGVEGLDEVVIQLVHEVNTKLDMVITHQQGVQSPVTGTDAHHGAAMEQEVKKSGTYLAVEPTVGPSVLTKTEVESGMALLQSGHKEDHLVALYTPYFQHIIAEVNAQMKLDLRLVNSECNTWVRVLEHERNKDLKPDLFVTSHENVQYKDAYANAPACSETRHFGRFPVWRCRDSLNSIWDAKVTLNDEGKGKVFRYVQIAAQECKDRNGYAVMRGVVFDAQSMMLITGVRQTITSLTTLQMDAAGSRKLLVDFLCRASDPWAAAVKGACDALNVTLGDIAVGSQDSASQVLLGAGAFGRAYRLKGDEVLKVSIAMSMDKEFSLMKDAHELCSQLVVKPLRYHEHLGQDGEVVYSAYILAECGQAVPRPVPDATTKRALATALLGLHTNGVIHGDPRLENIVMIGTISAPVFKWIDFHEGYITTGGTTSGTKLADVNTFVRSVCPSHAPVHSYDQARTVDELVALMG